MANAVWIRLFCLDYCCRVGLTVRSTAVDRAQTLYVFRFKTSRFKTSRFWYNLALQRRRNCWAGKQGQSLRSVFEAWSAANDRVRWLQESGHCPSSLWRSLQNLGSRDLCFTKSVLGWALCSLLRLMHGDLCNSMYLKGWFTEKMAEMRLKWVTWAVYYNDSIHFLCWSYTIVGLIPCKAHTQSSFLIMSNNGRLPATDPRRASAKQGGRLGHFRLKFRGISINWANESLCCCLSQQSLFKLIIRFCVQRDGPAMQGWNNIGTQVPVRTDSWDAGRNANVVLNDGPSVVQTS